MGVTFGGHGSDVVQSWQRRLVVTGVTFGGHGSDVWWSVSGAEAADAACMPARRPLTHAQ